MAKGKESKQEKESKEPQKRTAEETKSQLGKALKNASETGSPTRWKGLTVEDVIS